MDSLIDEAWRLYVETSDPCVVRPSIPILYFGDRERYVASPLKVITVALNPSRHEFPVHDRFQRFRPAAGIDPGRLDASGRDAYLAALNAYFRHEPYVSWFGWFEHVLRGAGASYFDGEDSTALHTDLCSPLATDPTWSKLDAQHDQFVAGGMALWHRLVENLVPDVIVISVARRYPDHIAYTHRDGWQLLATIPRRDETKRPYQAWAQRSRLIGGKPTLLVFGPAAQQPFATLTIESRQSVGRALREFFHAG